MIYVLLILLILALLMLAVGSVHRYARLGRFIAAPGVAIGLLVALFAEGLQGEGGTGKAVEWPAWLGWMGKPVYVSDALSAGLGAWCLLLGALYLWRVARDQGSGIRDQGSGVGDQRMVWRSALGILIVAVLYSLVHTWDLRVFAGQVLLLVMLAWALGDEVLTSGPRYSLLAMSLGASCLLGGVLLIGRATGGEYGLSGLPPSALTRWPLALIAISVGLWLGFAPLVGWCLRGYSGTAGALVQSVVVGVPVVTLIMRLQAVMATQGQAAVDWRAFMAALAWAGGLSALVAAAGTIVTAGTARWQSLLGAYTMGLVACALGLDTTLGRYAALTILLAFGAARMTLELSGDIQLPLLPAAISRRWPATIAGLSLAAVPLTVGFVGVWLLAAALTEIGRASAAVALAGVVVLSSCGVALHYAYGAFSQTQASIGKEQRARLFAIFRANTGGSLRLVVSLVGGVALVMGGIAPGLWLPQIGAMAGVTGGTTPISLTWMGMEVSGSLTRSQPGVAAALVLLLALAALGLSGIGWLVVSWMRSGATKSSGALLPTAVKRLEKRNETTHPAQPNESSTPNLPAPTPIWWLSLLWLEDGVWRGGALLLKLGARAGMGLGRLEGRYYMPLTLILVLLALLAITR